MPANFFDSNVLLYIASGDPDKANTAEEILAQGGAISVQVLNEIANVARRKMRLGWNETREFLSMVRGLLAVHPVTIETHEDGLALAERYGLSTYDGMIAAAALQADCETLWSEHLQHGMLLDGRLRIVDPFRDSGSSPPARSPLGAGHSHMTKTPSSRPEPSEARPSGGTFLVAPSTKKGPSTAPPCGRLRSG